MAEHPYYETITENARTRRRTHNRMMATAIAAIPFELPPYLQAIYLPLFRAVR